MGYSVDVELIESLNDVSSRGACVFKGFNI